jgi:hypothetical protein
MGRSRLLRAVDAELSRAVSGEGAGSGMAAAVLAALKRVLQRLYIALQRTVLPPIDSAADPGLIVSGKGTELLGCLWGESNRS